MLPIFKNYLLLSLFLIVNLYTSSISAEEIHIAIRANKGAKKGFEKWQATADYLSTKIPGYEFLVVPFENNSALNQAISQGVYQFCLTNPASAVEHTIRYGSQPLATLVNKRQGKGYAKFGSVIFTRANRDDINNLNDLKGKEFLAVDELGFGGWRVAWLEILKNNINPYTDFKALRFAGGIQQKVVFGVRDGIADAGTVRTDMLERLASSGKIKLSDFKIIGEKKTKSFPFLHSTELYPEWLFSAIGNVDSKLKTQVIAALFSIPIDGKAAKNGKYIGWISPLDYRPVKSLLKKLNVGPYNIASMHSFERLIKQYGYMIVGVIAVIILLTLTLLYMIRLNKRIIHTQNTLKSEINTRERAENILVSLAEQTLNFTNEESFFNDCIKNLAGLFNAKYAFIALFSNPEKTKVKTYTNYADGRFIENIEYDLKGTPCQSVLNLKHDFIGHNVSKKFPDDNSLVQLGIESYFGASLISSTGLMMGLISVMDTKPMKLDHGISPILQIFANRIAMEMQRKKEEDELHIITKQLSYQASHDALTGLINRREFEVRMKTAWDSANNNKEFHALCYLDLDQFKIVNDTCGHEAGDELLKQLAVRIKTETRGSDTLARLGGDEFGILLLDCSMQQAEEIANKLLATIKEFRFSWKENIFRIGASIGLVPINTTSQNISTLLQAADSACYVAKDLGRNRIHVYKEDDISIASREGDMRWVTKINTALSENNFLLYRQPIKALNSSLAIREHHEILIRMKDEDSQILLPSSFISAAERYNLMYSIDKWVIENSFLFVYQQYYVDECSLPNILYSINLSGLSIGNEKLPLFIDEMTSKYNVSPQSICFEITETAAISNFSQALKFIENMKQKGFGFALDDFGTGLCSYAYLKSLPVNYLKIDGSFVSGMFENPMNKAIIESIIHIANVMQVSTIAEWVENEEVYNELKKMGVHYVQGYHIGMPEPVVFNH